MKFTFLLCLFILVGCAGNAPPSLTPAGVKIWQANETVVALGQIQSVAIALNGVERCLAVCAPVLSDRNTGIVVDTVTDALTTIRAVPDGWKATALAAVQRIEMRLDAAGQTKLASYLVAARAVVGAL